MQFQKSIWKLSAGVLLSGLLVTPALAVTGTVETDGAALRVRAEASVAGEVLAKLRDGDEVELLSLVGDGSWYEISCGDVAGYVSSEFVKVAGEDADQLAGLPVEAAPIYLKVTASPLNVRSGPGTDYDKAGKLREGEVVTAEELRDGWYKLAGDEGYVSAEFVEEVDAEQAAQASASGRGAEVVNYAMQFKGCSYVYGGSSPRGFDCSGFTKYVYAQFGYSLYRSASDQLGNGVSVARSDLQPGDLVFFKQTSRPASHVGIYIGNNQFIHASAPGVGVIVSPLNDSGVARGYTGARRIL